VGRVVLYLSLCSIVSLYCRRVWRRVHAICVLRRLGVATIAYPTNVSHGCFAGENAATIVTYSHATWKKRKGDEQFREKKSASNTKPVVQAARNIRVGDKNN